MAISKRDEVDDLVDGLLFSDLQDTACLKWWEQNEATYLAVHYSDLPTLYLNVPVKPCLNSGLISELVRFLPFSPPSYVYNLPQICRDILLCSRGCLIVLTMMYI